MFIALAVDLMLQPLDVELLQWVRFFFSEEKA